MSMTKQRRKALYNLAFYHRKASKHCPYCKAPRTWDGVACPDCRVKKARAARERAQALRLAGLCVACKAPAGDFSRCRDCREEEGREGQEGQAMSQDIFDDEDVTIADPRGAYARERMESAEEMEREASTLRARAQAIRTTPAFYIWDQAAMDETAFLLDQAALNLDRAAARLMLGLNNDNLKAIHAKQQEGIQSDTQGAGGQQ